jgi:hypothetical protein
LGKRVAEVKDELDASVRRDVLDVVHSVWLAAFGELPDALDKGVERRRQRILAVGRLCHRSRLGHSRSVC